MNLTEMRTGNTFSFSTFSSAVLGSSFSKMKLVATATYEMAAREDQGLGNKHLAVHAALPAGTTRDATKLQYLLFRNQNNQLMVFAYEWLIADTITMTQHSEMKVTVALTNPGMEAKLLSYLAEGGYTVKESSLN